MDPSIIAQPTSERKSPPTGGGYSPVEQGACPHCHRPALRYSVGTHDLICAACPWRVRLSPAEHEDFLFYQIWPDGVVEVCAFLAAVAQRAHVVPAVPEPHAVYTRDRKWRVLPSGAETYADRAARLGEQAMLNGVQVTPLQRGAEGALQPWDGRGVPTLFRATSQRRNADGTPRRTYAPVEVSAFRAHCPCDASGLCTHLIAVQHWLVEWDALLRERERTPERVRADGEAATADLWGA